MRASSVIQHSLRVQKRHTERYTPIYLKVDVKTLKTQKITQKLQIFTGALLAMLVIFIMSVTNP